MSIALAYDATLSRVRATGTMVGLRDTFTRTVSNGWGTSDSGSVWTVSGTASEYATDGTQASMSLASVNVFRSASITTSGVDVDYQATFRSSAIVAGAEIIGELTARRADANNEYYARISIAVGGAVTLLLRKRVAGVVTTLGTYATGLVHNNTTLKYNLRLAAVGTSVRAKLWLSTAGEPGWQLSVVDAALSAVGTRDVRAVLATGNTNTLPVTIWVDDVISRGDAVVERSTDQIQWTTVRGAAALDGTTGAAFTADDYEFVAGTLNYYRVRRVGGSEVASITPAMDSVWIKNIARPFLNRAVTVVDWSDVTHESRNAVLPIIGRRDPIGMSDVRLGKRWELAVRAVTVAEADELVTTFASGEPVFIHVPGAACPVPGGYAVIGDVKVSRPRSPRSPVRYIELPLIQVAPPAPDVVGATMTWQAVIDTYATWADVIAANATWQDLLDGIADPGDVVVG